MRSAVIPVLGILFSILSGYCYWNNINLQNTSFGAVAIEESPTIKILIAYLITLAGVVLGTVYRNLQERKLGQEKVIENSGLFFRNVFRSIDFWMSLCASPLVFMILYNSISNSSFSSLALIAFENGFFITLIMDKIVPRNVPIGVPS